MQVHKRKDVSNRSLYLVCIRYETRVIATVFFLHLPPALLPLLLSLPPCSLLCATSHNSFTSALAARSFPPTLPFHCPSADSLHLLTAFHVYVGKSPPVLSTLKCCVIDWLLTGYQSHTKYYCERLALSAVLRCSPSLIILLP